MTDEKETCVFNSHHTCDCCGTERRVYLKLQAIPPDAGYISYACPKTQRDQMPLLDEDLDPLGAVEAIPMGAVVARVVGHK